MGSSVLQNYSITSGNCLSLQSSKTGWLEWLEANTSHCVLAWAGLSGTWDDESCILSCFMVVILPAIIFKHLGNSISFRWTNSGFWNKIKSISRILFWNFKFFISSQNLWLQMWGISKLMYLVSWFPPLWGLFGSGLLWFLYWSDHFDRRSTELWVGFIRTLQHHCILLCYWTGVGRILINCSYILLLFSELSETNSLITDPSTSGGQHCWQTIFGRCAWCSHFGEWDVVAHLAGLLQHGPGKTKRNSLQEVKSGGAVPSSLKMGNFMISLLLWD